jgi:Na+/H+ antiporter NhaD/arsenite permease-like protein
MSLLLLTAVLFAAGMEPDYATAGDSQIKIAGPIHAPQERAERSGETIELQHLALATNPVATGGLMHLAFAAPQDQSEPDAAAEPAAANETAPDAAADQEDGHPNHEVATWVTVLFGLILVAMIAALAFEEKIHAKKSLIVGSFAGLCLVLGTMINLMSFGQVHLPDGHDIDIPIYIPVIDWGVITIILGASLFVEVTSKSGVFSWLAIILTRRSGGDPWWLLMYYGVLTVVFSAVLNNVTAMIIIGSLTTVSLRKLNRTDLLLGFLITEGLLTNIGGLLTLISSVPNIIVGNEAGISFTQFFFVAAPYVAVATAVTLVMAKWKFGIKGLKTDEDKTQAKKLVESFDPAESVSSNRFFWFSVAALVLFIACLAGQAYLPFGLNKLGMGFVALFFACGVLWAYRHEVDRFYAAVDWDLLAFFAALFVVINVMEHAQVLGVLGQGIAALLELPNRFDTSSLLVSSAVASSVTDNIPLAAMLAKILGAQQIPTESPFWWAVIFGANLGGNITPIGSASTVVAMTIINRQKLGLTFVDFVKAAAPFAAVQLILAIVYLLLIFK